MSRHRYVVCYDIREPGRLRRTHDTMLGYGDPLQYSVFVCELSTSERLLMEEAVRRGAVLDEDSVLVIDLGPTSGVARARIRALGKGRVPERERLTVV
ncbi:MAG: CRISPR-associated endonuclease Cas2 [Actinomycetota bacterium]